MDQEPAADGEFNLTVQLKAERGDALSGFRPPKVRASRIRRDTHRVAAIAKYFIA